MRSLRRVLRSAATQVMRGAHGELGVDLARLGGARIPVMGPHQVALAKLASLERSRQHQLRGDEAAARGTLEQSTGLRQIGPRQLAPQVHQGEIEFSRRHLPGGQRCKGLARLVQPPGFVVEHGKVELVLHRRWQRRCRPRHRASAQEGRGQAPSRGDPAHRQRHGLVSWNAARCWSATIAFPFIAAAWASIQPANPELAARDCNRRGGCRVSPWCRHRRGHRGGQEMNPMHRDQDGRP